MTRHDRSGNRRAGRVVMRRFSIRRSGEKFIPGRPETAWYRPQRKSNSAMAHPPLPMVYKWYLSKPFRVYWSMPACTFGGWVSAGRLTEGHAAALIEHFGRFRDLIWRENPYDPLLRNIAIPDAADDFTQAIDLTAGYEAAKKRSDYAHRRAVRSALERGVTVSEASNFDQWKSYFSLYEASLERWKAAGHLRSRGYSLGLFRAIFETPADHRKLWLAQVNGKAVYGTLCFYWNRHAVSWNSAGAAEFFNEYRPNDLLQDTIIRDAAAAGYEWYDCNPSSGLKGVEEFKEHIGAQKLRSRVINKRSVLRRAGELLRGMVR